MKPRTLKSFLAAIALTVTTGPLVQAQEPVMQLPAPVESGYVATNGIEMFYATYGKGDGDPVVLLHGGLGQIEMLGPLLAAAAEGHRVIGFDLRGHGRTLPFDAPFRYETFADDVAGALRTLGVSRADVIGYSLGGGTALRLAIQHPELVERLVVVSAPFAFAGWHDYNQQGMRSISSALLPQMEGTPMHDAYTAVAPDPANFGVLLDRMGEWANFDYDWATEVPSISAPTMLVFGDWDAVRTSHIARFFELLGGGQQDAGWGAENMNANRLAIIPGETHYSIFASPKLGRIALAFVDGEDGSATGAPVESPSR